MFARNKMIDIWVIVLIVLALSFLSIATIVILLKATQGKQKVYRIGCSTLFLVFLLGGALRTGAVRTILFGLPTKYFWLGEALGTIAILILGISVEIAIIRKPQFVIELRSLRSKWNKQQHEVKLAERIFWFLIFLAMILIGLLLTVWNLWQFISNNPYPG